jgi:DNA-binding NarL/FixJ family response regulator
MSELDSGDRGSNDALTPRERAVAQLAALGRRNHEIAAELEISVRTVETHISNAMAKLGARNRTELAWRMRGSADE